MSLSFRSPTANRFEYPSYRKPALETYHDPNSVTITSRKTAAEQSANKNYITENALAVIMADARRPANNELDYTKKEDFGRTPGYLQKVKQEIEAEREYIQQVMEREKAESERFVPKTIQLPESERLSLLTSLKQKWEAVNKNYQTITHMVTLDTMGKVRRKEKYEIELQALEKSIEKLSKPFVFVQQ